MFQSLGSKSGVPKKSAVIITCLISLKLKCSNFLKNLTNLSSDKGEVVGVFESMRRPAKRTLHQEARGLRLAVLQAGGHDAAGAVRLPQNHQDAHGPQHHPKQDGQQVVQQLPGVCQRHATHLHQLLQVQPSRPRRCRHGQKITGKNVVLLKTVFMAQKLKKTCINL